MQDWNHPSLSYGGQIGGGELIRQLLVSEFYYPCICVGDNKRESGKWWTAAPVKYQYCIIQARFPLRDELVLSLKVSALSDLSPLTFFFFFSSLFVFWSDWVWIQNCWRRFWTWAQDDVGPVTSITPSQVSWKECRLQTTTREALVQS